ncbi:MAG: DUF4127 family protein [Acidobacteria bacterium]|nr:DUF4127 family protein [Acidobacteriota bacterium]
MKNLVPQLLLALCLGSLSVAQTPRPKLNPKSTAKLVIGAAGYLVLLPIDDRPAVGQFAQMIGRIADHEVKMPPRALLGRFTQPGNVAKLDDWLRAQDYRKVDALIVSLDMLCYGGLVASRTHSVSEAGALRQLEFFRWFKKQHPRKPVYVFSTIKRVAPTATAKTRGTHDKLARWAELKDRVAKTNDQKFAEELARLENELPPSAIADDLAARQRNLNVNLAALELVKQNIINEMVLLQDDAREFGLHRQAQARLRERLKELKLETRVPIYNGADEGSLSLVSRAILDKFQSKVRIAVVYSSEKSKTAIAPYEDHPLQFTVESQIRAAGGVVVKDNEPFDYRLYVNAPATERGEFNQFVGKLLAELKAQRPVALADLLFPAPHHSGADERLIEALKREKLIDAFVGYAAWNTAGNTLGTAIPAANLRTFFRGFFRKGLNDLAERGARAETAHLEFLLHRYVGDYLYHDVVRPVANANLRQAAGDGTVTYELTPELYEATNKEVSERLKAETEKFFAEHFQGKTYTFSYQGRRAHSFTVEGLKDLNIYLPWSRTFEVVVEYQLATKRN